MEKERKKIGTKNNKRNNKKVIILALVPFMLFWHWFEPAAKKNDDGIKAFRAQKYDEALNSFLSAKGLDPEMPQLKNNTAAALYQMKKYEEALKEFSTIDPEKADIPRADFHYNVGNSYFRLNKFDKALEHYKESLKLEPGDIDSKKNFEFTLKKLQEQKKKQDQKKKDDKDKKKDKKKKKEPEQKKQQKKQQKQDKHRNLMKYLNQNEKKQLKKKKRQVGVARKEKDW